MNEITACFVRIAQKTNENWGLSLCSHEPKRVFRPPFQRWRPTRSGARAARAHPPFLLLAFLCGSFRQRKAAKDLWYQNLIDAFSFEEKGPKEKALQKEKGRIAQAAGLPLLKKRGKTTAWRVRTTHR